MTAAMVRVPTGMPVSAGGGNVGASAARRTEPGVRPLPTTEVARLGGLLAVRHDLDPRQLTYCASVEHMPAPPPLRNIGIHPHGHFRVRAGENGRYEIQVADIVPGINLLNDTPDGLVRFRTEPRPK